MGQGLVLGHEQGLLPTGGRAMGQGLLPTGGQATGKGLARQLSHSQMPWRSHLGLSFHQTPKK